MPDRPYHAISNSNQDVSARNVREIAVNSEKSAAATKELAKEARYANQLAERQVSLQVESNMMLAEQVRTQWTTAQLIAENVTVARDSYKALNRIENQLEAAATLQENALAEQQRHGQILDAQLDVQSQQLRIQKEAYRKEKQDRALKHLLYELMKELDAIKALPCPMVRAYRSTILRLEFQRHEFSAEDLFEMADKKQFDNTIDELASVESCLSQADKESLDQFLLAHTHYKFLLDADPLNENPELHAIKEPGDCRFSPDKLEPPRFADGTVITPQLQVALENHLEILIRSEQEIFKFTVWPRSILLLLLLPAVGLGILSIITDSIVLDVIASFLIVVIGFCIVMLMFNQHIRRLFCSLEDAPWLYPEQSISQLRDLCGTSDIDTISAKLHEWSKYPEKQQKFEDEQRSRYERKVHTLRRRKKSAEKQNAQAQARHQELCKQYLATMQALRRSINKFLSRFPAMTDFYKPVSPS